MVMVPSMIYVPLYVACPAAIMAKRSHVMRKGIEIALLLHFLHILFVYDVNNLFLSYVILTKKMTKWYEFAHVFYFLFIYAAQWIHAMSLPTLWLLCES